MKKELIILTGSGQGIGKFLAQNLINNFDILLLSKSLNCKILSIELNKKKLNFSNYVVMNFDKKINTNKILKKIDLKNYKNINIIFAAGYVENFNKNLDVSEWKKVFNINLFGHLEILNALLPTLKKIKKQSRVIFFSGGGAANDFSEFPAYSASKTAIVRTVENLAISYNNFNISFFAIAPGAIKTNMLKKVLKHSKIKTKTSKEEVLNFILYYLTNSAKSISGRLVHIRDDKAKIKKNQNLNYLKLRRVE